MFSYNDRDWDPEAFPIKEADPKRCIEKLKLIGEVRSFSKGSIVSKSGEGGEGCFVVLEGAVTAQVITEDGIENQYINHKKGYILLEAQCFCEWTEVADFYASEDTETLFIKRADLMGAIEKDSELALYFIGSLSMKFRWYVEHCRNLSIYGAMHRLCTLLVEMAASYGEDKGDRIKLKKKIIQEDLAKQLHVNRLTIIRCMKELRDKGLIGTEDGHLTIPDLNALKEFRNEV